MKDLLNSKIIKENREVLIIAGCAVVLIIALFIIGLGYNPTVEPKNDYSVQQTQDFTILTKGDLISVDDNKLITSEFHGRLEIEFVENTDYLIEDVANLFISQGESGWTGKVNIARTKILETDTLVVNYTQEGIYRTAYFLEFAEGYLQVVTSGENFDLMTLKPILTTLKFK